MVGDIIHEEDVWGCGDLRKPTPTSRHDAALPAQFKGAQQGVGFVFCVPQVDAAVAQVDRGRAAFYERSQGGVGLPAGGWIWLVAP